MAVSANAYMTTTTNSSYTNPIVWSPVLEQHVYEESVFMQLGVNDPSQLNQPGSQYNYSFDSGYSAGVLTQGVPTPISAMSFTQVIVSFYAYGDAKQITQEQLVTGLPYVMNSVMGGFMGAMQENRDAQIVAELITTTGTGVYPNGTTSGTITSADTFNTDMVATVRRLMRTSQGVMPYDIVIHPVQEEAVLKLPGFVNAAQRGTSAVIDTGLIGVYLGIRFHVSNHISTATENSITVYKAIALGFRPYVYMQKRNPEFFFEEETKRDRAVTASWWEMFGVKILRNDSVRILTSA